MTSDELLRLGFAIILMVTCALAIGFLSGNGAVEWASITAW